MNPSSVPPPALAGLHAHDRFASALPYFIAGVARETGTSAVTSRIARSFVFLLGARRACVYLSDADGRALHLVASQNVDPASQTELASVSIADVQSPAACAFRLGLMQVLDAAEASFEAAHAHGEPARSPRGGLAFALPLFAGTSIVGAVSADFDELLPKDGEFLGSLSDALGALVDRARLLARVEWLEAQARDRHPHADPAAAFPFDLPRPPPATLIFDRPPPGLAPVSRATRRG